MYQVFLDKQNLKYLFDSPIATCTFSKVDDSIFFNSMIMKKGKNI